MADAINWAGQSEEEFQKKLDECSTEQERQQLVVKTLNDLYGENAEKYRENNSSLLDANAANLKLLESQSKMAEVVEPLTALWTNFKASAIDAITPAITFLSEKIQDLTKWMQENEAAAAVIEGVVTGLAAALGVLAGALAISNLISAVQKAFALLNTTMLANPVTLVVAALAGLVTAFVTLWNTSDEFRNFWIQLWEKAKTTASNAAEKFNGIVNTITSYFKKLPNNVKTAINGAIEKVKSWGNNMKTAGTNAAKKVVSAITTALKKIPGSVKSIGGNIVEGLWNGIKDKVSWIKNKLSGFKDSVMNALKDFFGIKSPSRAMRYEIGQFLPPGIAMGIQDTAKVAIEKMRQLKNDIVGEADFSGISVPQIGIGAGPALQAAGGTVVNNTYTFNQTNNSPKALDRLEVYRATKQQLKQLKRL